tara:strand:- start:595 stop:786 length:192 start_codon:yes stop_codon:yes gene_type:complete
MRIKWSNRVRIVEANLKAGRLKSAKDMARALLKEDMEKEMLLPQEIYFLKAVVKAKRVDDIGP